MDTPFKSKAEVVNNKIIKITAPDGEIFTAISQIGANINKETRNYELHLIEYIFDFCFSEDKEKMINNIQREAKKNALEIFGISYGNRQGQREYIGERIRQIRQEKHLEARDLALLVGIDAANLSRIENGKLSVGLDVLSKIANSLGYKVDLVKNGK